MISQVGGKYVQVSADHVQPEHRPALLRGVHRRRPRGGRRPARRAERPRLRRVHEHHRVAPRRTAAARSSTSSGCSGCRTPRPTRTCGTTRPRCPRWRTRSPPPCPPSSRRTRPTSRPTRRRSPPALSHLTPRSPLQGGLSGRPVATHRAGGRLPAERARRGQPDAVDVPGRHHERRRPVAAGRRRAAALFTGHKVKVFLYNQQVTDALTESLSRLRNRITSRSSASTRRCRCPGTTTRPGC